LKLPTVSRGTASAANNKSLTECTEPQSSTKSRRNIICLKALLLGGWIYPEKWRGIDRKTSQVYPPLEGLPAFGALIFLSIPLHKAFKPFVYVLVSNLIFTQGPLRARVTPSEVEGERARDSDNKMSPG
jgi:hypothetical protein